MGSREWGQDGFYLPAAPPAHLSTYEFHTIARNRVVGASMPASIPIRKHPSYQTEYSHRVGKHGWDQGRGDTEHCRKNTDVTTIPSRTAAQGGAERPVTPVKTQESIAMLERYRQTRASERNAVQCRRAAASLSASRAPRTPDPAADALALVQGLREAREGRLEGEARALWKAAYGWE